MVILDGFRDREDISDSVKDVLFEEKERRATRKKVDRRGGATCMADLHAVISEDHTFEQIALFPEATIAEETLGAKMLDLGKKPKARQTPLKVRDQVFELFVYDGSFHRYLFGLWITRERL